MKEEFRDIGFGYHVSNKGRIFKYRNGKRSFLAQNLTKGYLRVKLRIGDGKQKNFYVHRLVAMAFIYKPGGKEYVDHKDCNPLNNNVENLRWVSALENSHNIHTRKNVRQANKRMDRHTIGIVRISDDGSEKIYPSIKSAIMDGYYARSIYKCLNGQMKKHHGCRWKYQSSRSL